MTQNPDALADELERRIAIELFGPVARKARELMELVASEGGRMVADDERLFAYCNDMPGGDDTFNLCCDAGLIDQFGTGEDEFEVRLLDKGLTALRDRSPSVSGGDYAAAARRIQERVAAGKVDLRDVAALCGEAWDQDMLAGILETAARQSTASPPPEVGELERDLSCSLDYYTDERLPTLLREYVADLLIVETEEHVAREARAIVLLAAGQFTALTDDRNRLREALESMVAEKCDYMLINKLGDPEKQHTIRLARSALSSGRREA